jgi:transcriptional regulator with XRE-family HTH domain
MRDYLKKLRETLNLSQQSVADKLFVTRQYYQQIENGERQKSMDVSMAAKLALIFDIPVEQIISEEAKLSQEIA